MSNVGVVAIGRNEGDRLVRCLDSVGGRGFVVVYVDSGSTDGSLDRARETGAEVVELDLSIPFSAARARNAGLDRLRQIAPEVEFVQFVDGDCEVVEGWIDRATRELHEHPEAAVACGRRRERRPGDNLYNRLADLEWDTPVGEATACGGDALMRVGPLREVGAYNPGLIAGEEPELCLRLRRAGWTIRRVDGEMTLHDMAMTKFSQWWRRSVRAGHAYAEGSALHGNGPERHWVRETKSALVWGLVLPGLIFALAWPTRGASLLLLTAYLLPGWRAYRYYRRVRGWSGRDASTFAAFAILGKVPNAIGAARYWLGRLSGKKSRVMDYREPASAGRAAGS